MATAQYEITRKRDYVSEGSGITVRGGKLDLGLRTLKFEAEVKSFNLPKETADLLNLAININTQTERGKVQMVAVYFELRKKRGKYWELWGCKSLEHLLVDKLGLPVDGTFKNWCHLVEMFSTQTIETVRTDMLLEMIQVVDYGLKRSGFEMSDKGALLKEQKATYGGIFKWYKSRNGLVYDRQAFRESINDYVNKYYPAKATGPKQGKRRTKRVVVEDIAPDIEQDAPHVSTVTAVEEVYCSDCAARDAALAARDVRIDLLEQIIVELGGADRIPPRDY